MVCFIARILRVIFTLSILTTFVLLYFWLSGGEPEKSPKYSSFKQPQILKDQDTGDFLRETHGRGESYIVDQYRNCMICKPLQPFNDKSLLKELVF